MSGTGSMSKIMPVALLTILTEGRVGESYNVGGNAEQTNLAVVTSYLSITRRDAACFPQIENMSSSSPSVVDRARP